MAGTIWPCLPAILLTQSLLDWTEGRPDAQRATHGSPGMASLVRSYPRCGSGPAVSWIALLRLPRGRPRFCWCSLLCLPGVWGY